MAGEFTKPSSMYVAEIGKVASPSGINQNYAALGKDSLLFFDADGVFTDGVIGDETEGTIGSLASNIKIRDGAAIKKYDASGVFVEDVNLGQATESTKGQVALATAAEVLAGTDAVKAITPATLAGLFGASSKANDGYARLPIKVDGAFVEIIIQWGTSSSISGDSSLSVTLPLTFPITLLSISAIQIAAINTVSQGSFTLDTLTTSSFIIRNGADNTGVVRWMAIGY